MNTENVKISRGLMRHFNSINYSNILVFLFFLYYTGCVITSQRITKGIKMRHALHRTVLKSLIMFIGISTMTLTAMDSGNDLNTHVRNLSQKVEDLTALVTKMQQENQILNRDHQELKSQFQSLAAIVSGQISFSMLNGTQLNKQATLSEIFLHFMIQQNGYNGIVRNAFKTHPDFKDVETAQCMNGQWEATVLASQATKQLEAIQVLCNRFERPTQVQQLAGQTNNNKDQSN